MRSRVRAVNVTPVHPARAAAADDLELAFFDIAQIAKIPIQRLFFFDGPGLPPFPSVVSALRSSLADTLAVFFPLAGELAFRPSSGAVVVDCSPAAVSSGVRFVEAEYLGSADDMRRLAREEEHDTEAFSQLVPDLDVAQLPSRVLAVQVTRPAAGHGVVAAGVTIRSLKQQCAPPSGAAQQPASTYVAISSLVWASLVRAKSMNHADDTHFLVASDCRRRLRPAPGEGYFGNCIRPCFARVNAGELRGEGGVARAAAAIRERVREDLERSPDPLEGMERVLDVVRGVPRERLTSVASSHRFMAYETDFGWGGPSRVELVSMFSAELVTLLGAREAGAVQVSVGLRWPLMEAFAATFLALAGSS